MEKVLLTSQARADLANVWLYISTALAPDDSQAADIWLSQLEQTCEMLAEEPRMGRDGTELAPGLLGSDLGEFIIFYRRINDGIQILRVLHADCLNILINDRLLRRRSGAYL